MHNYFNVSKTLSAFINPWLFNCQDLLVLHHTFLYLCLQSPQCWEWQVREEMSRLLEIFQEFVPKSWCGIDFGVIALQNLRAVCPSFAAFQSIPKPEIFKQKDLKRDIPQRRNTHWINLCSMCNTPNSTMQETTHISSFKCLLNIYEFICMVFHD